MVVPLLLTALLSAADAPPADAVALVGGEPITLRQVEDSLLAKEGKEAVQTWVDQHLERIDWDRLGDEDPVLTIGFNKITRKELATALAAKGAGKVRDDLINIAIVDQALKKAGVVVLPAQVRATWERMARKFQEDMAKKGNTQVDLASWIKTKEGLTIEQFQAQPGFRMLAGLQALIHLRAATEFSDEVLRAAFAGRPERYREAEAVELSAITIPFRGTPGKDGQTIVDRAERERLSQVMDSLHRQISSGQVSFEKTFEVFGKGWDAGAGPGGRLGWIPRDGRRLDGSPVAEEVVRAAWTADRFPTLLPPLMDGKGITLAVVHGHRPQRDPDFIDAKERVRADLIDETLERRTDALLKELKDTTPVEYLSLPGAKDGRR